MKQRTVEIVAAATLAVVLVLALVGATFAMGRSGPQGTGPNPTPTASGGSLGASGRSSLGPGDMMGGSYGSGGMMGGYGPGGMMGSWGQGNANKSAISLDQAQKNVQNYLKQNGNSDLTIDEVMAFQNNFYAIVKEKSTGIGAFEVLVNKGSGIVTPEPGPNMMWNTKYGMMSQNSPMGQHMGYSNPTGPMTVSVDQAKQIAQEWLDQNQPDLTTEAPDKFYGYYTVHILKGGKVTGMLSVNGYSGQVWYHTWHGTFIQMKDLGA